MKRALPALLAAMLFAALLPVLSLADDVSRGTWSIQPSDVPGKIQLELRAEGSGDHVHTSTSQFGPQDIGLQPGDLSAPSHAVHFAMRRDAGTIDFTGSVGDGVGAGHYTFAPSSAYLDALAKRGLNRPSPEEQLAATTLDISIAYIDGVTAAGVRPSSFEKTIAFRALGLTPQRIRVLRQQFGPLDEGNLITFAALHIDSAYIRELAAAGYGNLTAGQLTELKALHVDAAYIRRVQAHGFKHPTVEQLVQLKAMHVI